MQCTAHKRDGTQCKKPAVPGRNTCRLHGGLTPRGPASPKYKHGRYSKFLPARLSAMYEQSLADPEMLNLRHEIALIDARMAELLGRLEQGESMDGWAKMGELVARMKSAAMSGDTGTFQAALAEIEKVAEKGMGDYAAWNMILDSMDKRRQLVEAERRRLIAMQASLDVNQALAFAGQLIQIVSRHVADRKTLSAIIQEAERMMEVDAVVKQPLPEPELANAGER